MKTVFHIIFKLVHFGQYLWLHVEKIPNLHRPTKLDALALIILFILNLKFYFITFYNLLSWFILSIIYFCGVTAPINRIYPLWGASPSRFIGSSPSVGRTNQGLDLVVVIASPTSARVPSHIWFISFWSNHMCTTRTHGEVTPHN